MCRHEAMSLTAYSVLCPFVEVLIGLRIANLHESMPSQVEF